VLESGAKTVSEMPITIARARASNQKNVLPADRNWEPVYEGLSFDAGVCYLLEYEDV
jgi:hypothetical protein